MIGFPGAAFARARLRSAGALAFAICALALLPSGASASAVNCSGKTLLDKKDHTLLQYAFHCSEEIKNYSIVSSRPVSAFSTEVDVLDATGNVQSAESFGCEGIVPSAGFGCDGDAKPGHTVSGNLNLDSAVCSQPKHPLSLWLVVTALDDQVSGPPVQKDSSPFQLGLPKCRAQHARRRHGHH